MKRLALIAVLAAAAALPAAAPGAACSPLSCAASGVSVGNGYLAARPSGAYGIAQVVDLRTGETKWSLPQGMLVGHTLVEQSQTNPQKLIWHDALTGKPTGTATIRAAGPFSLVGLSQDGSRAVLVNSTKQESTFVIVSRSNEQIVKFPTQKWAFDALRGNKLYLLRYLKNGYEIRLYDLAAGRLAAKPLKDPNGSSRIWGIAWERVSSPDGRYVFTLYVGGDGGAMVHQLDLKTSAARCIDLPGSRDFNSATTWAMELSPNGKTLWAVSPTFGRVVGIDVAQKKVRVAFGFKKTSFAAGDTGAATSVSAMSPDGAHMAVGTGGKIFYVSMAHRVVVQGVPHSAIALGYAPDGTTLWVVDKAEQVTALPAL
ncbi:MAG: WD40 repeat domain-containing protein [Gaiellaceae bacterium]